MKKKFRKRYNQSWEEFGRATPILPAVEIIAKRNECSIEDAEQIIETMRKSEIWQNNLYNVLVERYPQKHEDGSNSPECIYMSIKRLDKHSIHDWRHLQRIKNEICGPEWEAVELYPAESRLIDEANQYHLWAFPMKLDLGFHQGRMVSGPKQAMAVGARQRAF